MNVLSPSTSSAPPSLPASVEAQSPRKSSRLYLIPLLCGTALSLCFFFLAQDSERWDAWSAWLPYGQWPGYGDLSVTLQHLGEAAAGQDPLSDPKSEFAYPRVVLALHHLGLHRLSSDWLGLWQSLAVVLGLVLLLRPRTIPGAIACALLFFSPSIVLGFERANLDFALFLLCAGAGMLWARSRSYSGLLLPIAGLIAAAMMKLHPVFALGAAVVVETGRRRLVWLTGLVLLLVFWAINHADFALIGPKLPVTAWGSWGCLTFFLRVERFLASDRESYVWIAGARWSLIAVVTYAMLALAAYAIGRRLSARFATVRFAARDVALYWIGAAICAGSFAGANIAYRWIFALLAVPLLLRAARSGDSRVEWWARLTLAGLALSLGAPLSADRFAFLVTQMANWSCILSLIAGGAALQHTAFPAVGAPGRNAGPPRSFRA